MSKGRLRRSHNWGQQSFPSQIVLRWVKKPSLWCARHYNSAPISISQHHLGHPVYRACVVKAAICIVRIMVREVPIRPKPHVNKLQASFAFHPVAI
ncbi:MAG TPA: hypothetical protein VKG24_00625, partial [Pseudolabrys sp.]|nr:hypothetical protein [Pseudolabrys sp.]